MTEAGGALDGVELHLRVTLDVVVADGALSNKFLFFWWYVLHQDLIRFAERTSKPASFMTSFGSTLMRFTACLL